MPLPPPDSNSGSGRAVDPPHAGNKKSAPVFVRAGDAVSKQPKMKMMLTVKAYLEVMVLYQIG